jgi:tetratricopeptide (TPR) repeat protein
MLRRASASIGLSLLSVLAVLCAGDSAFGQGITVAGRIRTEDGKPLHVGVRVWIETPSRQSLAEQFAGSDGEFEFERVPPSEFTLAVSAEGYQPFRMPLDLRWEATKKFVNIHLVPEEKDRRASAEAPALTDHAAPRKAKNEDRKGRRALENGDLAKAQDHLEKAVGEYPCYARAQTDLAMALAGQDLADPAERALRKSLECDPDYHPAYALLGLVLNTNQRYTESEQALLEGLRRAPNAWKLHYQMGISQFGQNRNAKAQEHYLRALSLSPDRPGDIHARLADVFLKQGAYREAYAQLEAYLQADPVGRFSEAVRERMAQIESSGVLVPEEKDPAVSSRPEAAGKPEQTRSE